MLRAALLPSLSPRCVEAGQPASTPLASEINSIQVFKVNPMPVVYVYFFLSGLAVGVVIGLLISIATRA